MKIGYLMQAGVPDVRKDPFSGPSSHVRQVIRELERLGHHVHLLANLDGQIWKSDGLENFQPVSTRLEAEPFRLFERAVRRLQSGLRLPYASMFESLRFAFACCQELADCDVFYERMGWMGYGGGLAAHWLGIPLVLEVNGDHLGELSMHGMAPRGVQRWLSVALMKMAVRLPVHVVATGEGWRMRFIGTWQTSPEKVTVIENGSQFVDMLKRDQLRSFRPRPDSSDVVTVAYIGSFDPWQGVPILIRATAGAIADGIPARIVLIGSSPGIEVAKQLVHELHLGESVIFTGQLAPKGCASWLMEADIGVAPYCGRVEYSGLKLLDYKAAGLAIIVSGKDGQPSIIEHGRNGWVVPPCDEHALYQAIVRLSSDVELRTRIGREARADAEQFHGWSRTAERLSELFWQVSGR